MKAIAKKLLGRSGLPKSVGYALYRKTGDSYWRPKSFPVAIFDPDGYCVFSNEKSILPWLSPDETHIYFPKGIKEIKRPKYRRFSAKPPRRPVPARSQSDAAELLRVLKKVPTTEKEAVIATRLGQGKFRNDLIKYWGACAVTRCSCKEALRASHIKSWSKSTNRQRLDPFNGLLLLGTLDALFDAGLIAFSDSGQLLWSSAMSKDVRRQLGLRSRMRLKRVEQKHQPYLRWHRRAHGFNRDGG